MYIREQGESRCDAPVHKNECEAFRGQKVFLWWKHSLPWRSSHRVVWHKDCKVAVQQQKWAYEKPWAWVGICLPHCRLHVHVFCSQLQTHLILCQFRFFLRPQNFWDQMLLISSHLISSRAINTSSWELRNKWILGLSSLDFLLLSWDSKTEVKGKLVPVLLLKCVMNFF